MPVSLDFVGFLTTSKERYTIKGTVSRFLVRQLLVSIFSNALMQILFSGCHSSTNMTLRLIQVENFSGILRKILVNPWQPFRYILMYRTLAYSKRLRRFPDRRLMLHYVPCNLYNPFFNTSFQSRTLMQAFLQCMRGKEEIYPKKVSFLIGFS